MKQVAYCVLVIAVVGLISFFVIEESNSNIAETATFEESTEEEITSIIAEETTSIT